MQIRRRLVTATALAIASSTMVAVGAVSSSAVPQDSVPSAAAATGSVKVKKLPTAVAPYRGKVKVKPKYAVKGKAVADKATLTVKSGRKVVARNKKWVKLAPGTYSVTQTVKYRPYTHVNKPVVMYRKGRVLDFDDTDFECAVVSVLPQEQLVADCTLYVQDEDTDANYSWDLRLTLTYDAQLDSWMYGDLIVSDANEEYWEGGFYPHVLPVTRDLTYAKKVPSYGKSRTTKRTQKLTIKPGAKPRTCATYADFKKVAADFDEPEDYGHSKSQVAKILHSKGTRSSFSDYGSYVIEFRNYKPCNARASISVGFFAGYAYSKTYSD